MGRKPNIDQLALEKAGVTANQHGIQVNDHLMSSNPAVVFAIGDVVGRVQTQINTGCGFEGRYVATRSLYSLKDSTHWLTHSFHIRYMQAHKYHK